MAKRKRDTSLGKGVYFADDQYVGIARRFGIIIVDLVVIAGVGFGLGYVSYYLSFFRKFDEMYKLNGYLTIGWMAFVFIYMAVLKPSPIRTLGLQLFDAKVMTLRGKRPSPIRMCLRMIATGVFNPLFDLFWAGIDEDRQALRDRYTFTCVVNANAEPIGEGEIHLVHYSAAGWNLTYPRVVRPKS